MSYYAMEKFLESPVWGKGLGDFLKYKTFKVNSANNYYIDNTWFYILWKGGLIGFILFAWVYLRFLKAAYFVSKNSPDLNTRIICMGLFGGIIALLLLAFLSPLLIKYKTNVLMALLFSYVEFERNTIINLKNKAIHES